jgi:hypothetical protein
VCSDAEVVLIQLVSEIVKGARVDGVLAQVDAGAGEGKFDATSTQMLLCSTTCESGPFSLVTGGRRRPDGVMINVLP